MNQFSPSIFPWDVKYLQLMPGWKGYIEAINPQYIEDRDIHRIWEIEKDMWAQWLWEYVQCTSCGNIDGKYDIYTIENIGYDLIRKTVSEIENILWKPMICCTKCGWESQPIFPEQYREEISSRYSFAESFLSVYRDLNGQIHGFMDGYISNFSTIYKREFEHYYGENSEKVSRRVGELLGINPWDVSSWFVCITALWTDEEHASMFTIYALLKSLCSTVALEHPHINAVYESVLWTNTHAIYHACGWQRIRTDTLDLGWVSNTHEWYVSDIFVHKDAPSQFLHTLWGNLKNFIRWSKGKIEEIVEKDR